MSLIAFVRILVGSIHGSSAWNSRNLSEDRVSSNEIISVIDEE
jgi:hypothetical protein